MIAIRLYKPFDVIREKFIITQAENLLLRFTSASSSLNYQYDFSKRKREYSTNSKQHTDDSNDLYYTLEEWNKAKERMQTRKVEYAEMKRNLLGLIKTVNKQSAIYFQKVIGHKNVHYQYDPSNIKKAFKFENIVPNIENNMRQDIFGNTASLFQGTDWNKFWNKMNPIMMQLKLVKQYIHPENTIAKELMHRIKTFQGRDNKILMDFWKELNKWNIKSKAYLPLHMKLKCLYEKFSENSIQAQMMDSLLTEKVFVDDGKFDYEVIFQKYFSSPTFKKAINAYSSQIILIEELIKQVTKKINDENSENHCEEESTDNEPSMLEKFLNIDKNIAFIMALDMIIAGVDTTSTLIDTLYYLATDESTREFLENEINMLIPDENFELNSQSDLLNTMSYLKTCVKEAYWMYPISAGIIRYFTKDTAVSGYQIPIETLLLFNQMCISLTEKYHGKSNEHIPERKLKDNLNSDISYKKAFSIFSVSFGFGFRSGKWRFPELKLGINVTNLMKKFNLSSEALPSIRTTISINDLLKPLKFIFKEKKNQK